MLRSYDEMICINKYENNILNFKCTNCNKEVSIKTEVVNDNTVKDIIIKCPYCEEEGVLFVLRCKDDYMSSILLNKLQDLRNKYYEEC
jgi:hypothetical protein